MLCEKEGREGGREEGGGGGEAREWNVNSCNITRWTLYIWTGNSKDYVKHLCYAILDIIRILSVYLEVQ